MEKIAVLLSSYNGEKYIRQQIDSIVNQSLKDYQVHLFIRDDGSTDNTIEEVEKTGLVGDKITIIKGINIGSVASFFTLIRMAKDLPEEYQYFSLADQDDVWKNDKLQVSIDAITDYSTEKPVLYGSSTQPATEDLEIIPKKKRVVRPIKFYNSIIQNFIPGHTYVMNRALLNIIYDANPSKIYVHDSYILNAAIINGKLIYDSNPHVIYRQHSGNQLGTSNSGIKQWIVNRIKRIKKGDSIQYARQIEYIYEKFGSCLSVEENTEFSRFLEHRKNIISRLYYICQTKLYRQKKFETLAFKLLYFSGGYNTL